MLKNTKKLFMAGAIISTMVMGGLFTDANASTAKAITADINKSIITDVNSMNYGEFDVIEYIKSLEFLTGKEKQQLLETEKQLEPIYEKMNKIYDEIDLISDKILQKTDELYEQIDKIYEKQDRLWNIFFESMDQNQGLNDKDRINALKSLTKKEKDILINEQMKIDKIYDEINRIYDEFEKESEPLYEKIEGLYKKIDKMNEKNEDLWEKVQENDKTPILY